MFTMKRSRLVSGVASAAIVALMLAAHNGPSAAQGAAPGASVAQKEAPAGPVPRTPDGRPDLSGVWWPGRDVPVTPLRVGEGGSRPAGQPRHGPTTFSTFYQPWAAAKAKELDEKDDPALRCVPPVHGPWVSLLGSGLIGQIMQTPKFVILLTETYHSFKLVPTDGRPHRDDVAPSYRGDSVGRWEGDTLVVDTINFSTDNWILDHGNVSFHSDALHLVERYRRLDAKRIAIDTRMEDSKVLTRPWDVATQTLELAPFDQIMEVGCTNVETVSLMEGAAKENYGRK
jgi:hypothetical protein